MCSATIHELPSTAAEIKEAACEWLIKLDGDEPITPTQMEELQQWVQGNPAHRQALERVSVLWDRMDVLAQLSVPLVRIDPPRAGVSRLYAALPKMASRATALVAGVTIAALVGVALSMWRTTPQHALVGDGFYSSRVGEIVTLPLVDGSVVELNTDTQVEIDYGRELRAIRLSHGEAHFEVAHNSAVPFVVYAGGGAVRAVGTAFDVRLLDTELAVTVTHGRVDLESLDGRVVDREVTAPNESGNYRVAMTRVGSLTAGQTTRVRLSEHHVGAAQTLTAHEVRKRLSWREGLLTFSGETLDEVIADVSRYTKIEVVIIDPKIKAVRLGGQFKIGETDALLDVLQANFGIRVHRISDQRVELSAAGT